MNCRLPLGFLNTPGPAIPDLRQSKIIFGCLGQKKYIALD